MINQFRPTLSGQSKKNLKTSLLKDVKKSLTNDGQFIGMLTDAKNQLTKYSKKELEADAKILDTQVTDPAIKEVVSPQSQPVIIVPEQTSLKTQPNIQFEQAQDLPLVFVNPPLNLKQQRSQQVRFEIQNHDNQQDIKLIDQLSQDNQKLKASINQMQVSSQKEKDDHKLLMDQNIRIQEALKNVNNENKKQEDALKELSDVNLYQLNEIKQLQSDKNLEMEKSLLLSTQIKNNEKYEFDHRQTNDNLQINIKQQDEKMESQFNIILSLKQKLNIKKMKIKSIQRDKDLQQVNFKQLDEKNVNQELQIDGQKKNIAKLQSEIQRLIEINSNNLIEIDKIALFQKQINPISQEALATFKEMSEARNQAVHLTKTVLEKEEKIRQMQTQNEILKQREQMLLEFRIENQRVQDENNSLEVELEKQKKINRSDLEDSCLQRDVNQKREVILNDLEDELNLKQQNLDTEIQNMDKYRNTIEELKNIIKNREITIANLYADTKKYQDKIEEELAIAKDRLQLEQTKTIKIDQNRFTSPFTVPQMNQKFQRQYV